MKDHSDLKIKFKKNEIDPKQLEINIFVKNKEFIKEVKEIIIQAQNKNNLFIVRV